MNVLFSHCCFSSVRDAQWEGTAESFSPEDSSVSSWHLASSPFEGFHRPAPPILPASSCMCTRCNHVLPAPEEKWGTHFRRRLTCRRWCKNSTCLDAVWFFPFVTSTAGSEDGLAGKELLWVCLCEVTVRILLESLKGTKGKTTDVCELIYISIIFFSFCLANLVNHNADNPHV